jgi:hypothetical protein
VKAGHGAAKAGKGAPRGRSPMRCPGWLEPAEMLLHSPIVDVDRVTGIEERLVEICEPILPPELSCCSHCIIPDEQRPLAASSPQERPQVAEHVLRW